MGKISDRIMGSVDEFAGRFGDRLATWGIDLVGKSITKALEDMEPGAIAGYKDVITKLKDDPLTPPEMRTFYEKSLVPGNWLTSLLAGMTMVIGTIGALLGGSRPIGNLLSYVQDVEVHSYRLDPMTVITLLRRFPGKWDKLEVDLREQGFSDERIKAFKDATLYYPAPPDLVHWQAREVFEPEMVRKYGLDDELGAIERDPFYKAGMTDEQITNYWRAHWEHASWMQIVEMLHRGLVTEEDVYDWFRLVEIPPFWRDLLIKTAYTWPTRVDVRRWWDMRTIEEPRLRELYSGMGYRGKNLDDYVLWTKVYVAFPDLIARWSKGWITLDDVRTELTALGMPAERLEEFIQMKVKAEQPERTANERDITKTDIIKGVKQGVITRGEGEELLVDMGYSEDESVYILEINIPRDEEDVVVKQRDLTKTDIIKGLQAEIITDQEALERLMELRYSRADATFLLDIYKALISPPAKPREREASKADILLAVKKGLVHPEDGYLMLQDIGFTPEASEFILAVRAETSPFSPINFAEFKDRTAKYKIATGREAKPMPEELKAAAEEVVKLTDEVEALTLSITEEKRGLIEDETLPEAAKKRLTELEVARNRAIAELERVRSEYESLLAEWKHGLS